MAKSKRFDANLLRTTSATAPNAATSGSELANATPTEALAIERGPAYRTSVDSRDLSVPAAVLGLRPALQHLAQSYLGARRRSGIALLEAARWLSEARAAAEYGEWELFLAAIETPAATAEQLMRIYDTAMASPQFAEAVVSGRINQSVAERLTRRSTPPQAFEQVLQSERPLTVGDVARVIHEVRQQPSFGGAPEVIEVGPAPSEAGAAPQIIGELRRLANLIDDLAPQVRQSSDTPELRAALNAVAQAVQRLRLEGDR